MTAQPPDTHGSGEPEWVHGHHHEPNPAPPTLDATIALHRPDGHEVALTPDDLARLPQQTVPACCIVSTGHGTSGPFTFGGVRLADVIAAYCPAAWQMADVISADGFGNRVLRHEAESTVRPILLATTLDGTPLTRDQGLVRLIVPSETDDALRQVKWVARIEVR